MSNDGVKDLDGKLKVDLIPYAAIKAIAQVREYGNNKYGHPFKWHGAGIDSREFIAAAIRHLYKHLDAISYKNRSIVDDESGLPHINHAITSLALAIALIDKEGSDELSK